MALDVRLLQLREWGIQAIFFAFGLYEGDIEGGPVKVHQLPVMGGKFQESVQNGFLLSRVFGKPLLQGPLFILKKRGADKINGSVFGGESGGFDIKKKDTFRVSQKMPDGFSGSCMYVLNSCFHTINIPYFLIFM